MQTDHQQASVLHLASFYGRPQLIQRLVRHGQQLNQRDAMQRTPLHLAGNAEVATLLIGMGASVNATDALGDTPLHLARNAEVALVLILAGADLDALNIAGLAPDQGARADVAQTIALIREEQAVACEMSFVPIRLR